MTAPGIIAEPLGGPAGPALVRVFRSAAEIEELRRSWSAQHPNADLDFYLTMNRSRADAVQPFVMALYRGELPEAILAARIERSGVDLNLGYLRLFAPKVRMLNGIYQGLLGDWCEENAAALLGEARRVLKSGEADVAVFRFLRTDSAAYRLAARAPGLLARDHCLAPQTHRSVSLPDGMEAFRRRFSAKVRKNHRWQANKLIEEFAGNVTVRCFRTGAELDALFRDAESIASRTYQRGLGVGFEDTPAMRTRLGFDAARGRLRAWLLYTAGRPSAFWIGTVYGRTFFSSFMGYDPDLARHSPGTYLILQVIEGLAEGGAAREVDTIDFGLGDAPYKSLMGDSEWQEATVYIFASRFRPLALNALRTPVLLLNRWFKSALERTDALPRVKRFWRRRRARG